MSLIGKTKAQLHNIISTSQDDDVVDEAYNELERREMEDNLIDHTESDRLAAFSDRYEQWRNEY